MFRVGCTRGTAGMKGDGQTKKGLEVTEKMESKKKREKI